MDKLNITFNLFKVVDGRTKTDIYADLVKQVYSDEHGYGFTDVYVDEMVLSALLVKKVPTYYKTWDETQQMMVNKTLLIMKEIKFFMDFISHHIYVEGGVSSMNHLKQALRNTCWKTFVYEDLTIKPFNLLQSFIKDNIMGTLNEICIADFKFENVLIGKYTAKLIDSKIPFELIQQHSDTISKFKASVQIEDADAEITIKNRNSMVISCSEEDKYMVFDYISSKIY